MNSCLLLLFSICLGLLTGCKSSDAERIEKEGIAPGEVNKWGDPNFRIISVGAFNYTDYDIYGVFVMPAEKNDIDFAAESHGQRATRRDESRWEGGLGSSPALAWDLRWRAPKKFKVWWHRVTDLALYEKSGPFPKGGGMFDPYDPYTIKGSRPGMAWCEGEIEIREKFGEPFGEPYPGRKRDQLVLYFYPDGTVQGHLEFAADSDIKLVDIAKRDQLPNLKARACLKEVDNPFFGKKRPLRIN